MASKKTTFAENKETYEAALRSLFTGRPEDTENDLVRICDPNFTQRDNNDRRDFAGFIRHIRWLREILPPRRITLDVVQCLRDGAQLADRHTSATLDNDGVILSRAETFMLVRLAEDGRIKEIIEQVKMLS